MPHPILFDAVIFDLDGTLVATDRFWIESAERGARRAFEMLGLVRVLPTPAEWLSLVGTPLAEGFRELFPDLSETQRSTVLACCVEEEEWLLRTSGAPQMPFASETLRGLHAEGLRLGVASNCSRSYLEHMLAALGLHALAARAYCRDMPGIETKGDMIERLLEDFATRSAVMVGDRASDRDAAWENGLPHVHCAFGFAGTDEPVECEARIESLDELSALLRQRSSWIQGALELLGLFDRPGQRIGITGGAAAGKTLFARDAARLLCSRGRPAVALTVEAQAPGPGLEPGASDPLALACDLGRLEQEILLPHERGQELLLPVPGLCGEERVPRGASLVLEGSFLLGSRLCASLDRLIHLAIPEELGLRRFQGRDARKGALPGLAQERELFLELQRDHERLFPPRRCADLVLDASNPLGLPSSGRAR